MISQISTVSGGSEMGLEPPVRSTRQRLLNTLPWSALIVAGFLLTPLDIEAAKLKTNQKQTVRGSKPASVQASAPVRRLTKGQARNAVFQQPGPQAIDPADKRALVSYRVRPGETLTQVLSRHNVSKSEALLWARTMTRTMGSEALPAGKETHLFFSKSLFRGRAKTQGQLKAVEVDQDDSFTLTLEKGIRGIFVQQREKPYDVEVKTASAAIENSLFDDGRKAGVLAVAVSRPIYLGRGLRKGRPQRGPF